MFRNIFHRNYGICAVIAILILSGQVQAASLDRVIAVINDDVITQLELENRLTGLAAEIRSAGADAPPEEVMRKQMLQRMIDDKLQLQAARRFGLNVSEQAVDEAVMSVAQNNNLSLRQLREALASEGIPYALFRESISTQMLIGQIYTRHIRNRVEVTDEELDGYIANGGGKADAREYDVSHILIEVSENADAATMDAARNKAKNALSSVQRGMDFAEAAATYSDSPDASEGGRLGWRTPDELPALFTEALSRTDVGATTNVLQSPRGFHILYINEAKGDNATAVPQTNVRHILIRTDEFLSEDEAKHRLEGIRERIVNGEDFGQLAQIHSADSISASKGGELGWVMPGELTGSFEDAMNELNEGELSEPVQSPFGLHLIQVLDRREENMGEAVTRGRARAQLVQQKSEERYQRWLRQLRNNAYVEILDQDLRL